MQNRKVLRVVAGVVKKDGKILLTQRYDKGDETGLWEFPGGKVETCETDSDAICRELEEELAIQVEVVSPLIETLHHYPDKSILLCSYECQWISGSILLRCHQKMAWVEPEKLLDFELSAADVPVVRMLAG
ncbi:(deoxy)nucleoside triphosphate pyrophosphohydrolase [Veronia pacifica]|uniref:8-oxo-dGTP diphosphatase n=1 Tax=Veronia pacifica TaxID=1080227 RepID=A0A1C3EJW1_9GAMM|nr:(deoxy)nucleoside triphosphate pyrophosphohydrolase [Veronia pacifica]ODA33520.1 thiamine-phosphate phosphorylase [Veronia pacifica]